MKAISVSGIASLQDVVAEILFRQSLIISCKPFSGNGATLLPDILVEEGAFIGAGAVVTKDVPPYHVVMGVPARTVRILEGNSSEDPSQNQCDLI